MLARATAHEEGDLHVPHGKGQVRIGAFAADKPRRVGQHAVEHARHTLDLGAVADFRRLGDVSVDSLMEEIEPAEKQFRQLSKRLPSPPLLSGIPSLFVTSNERGLVGGMPVDTGLTRQIDQSKALGQRLGSMTIAGSGISRGRCCTRFYCPCRRYRSGTTVVAKGKPDINSEHQRLILVLTWTIAPDSQRVILWLGSTIAGTRPLGLTSV